MKKLLITFITLICLTLPVLARDYYNELKDLFKTNNMTVSSLIINDFNAYNNGRGSMFGVLQYSLENATSEQEIDYLTKALIAWKLMYKNIGTPNYKLKQIEIITEDRKYISSRNIDQIDLTNALIRFFNDKH